jgi:maleamate amidohydrolase
MDEWMKAVPEGELRAFRKPGFMAQVEMGQRPALIVIDVTYGFTGSESLSYEDAVLEFSSACGPVAWATMPKIRDLVQAFRARSIPIVFTRSDPYDSLFTGNAAKSKTVRKRSQKFSEFPPQITPQPDEWILEKTKASCFFHTALTTYLVRNGVDTLIFCGVSTSGCVRASVVDSTSHGYPTFVVADCCFDRSEYAHTANLFDMHAKYASVVTLDALKPLLQQNPVARSA